jgi:non-heme chloroperoxidase
MPYFSASDGTKIYYEDLGEGFPLMFLHPWPTDHAMWMLQIPVFSERYRIITPDSRGLGRSAKPHIGYSLERLSDDVDDLMNHLGIDKAFVVGNSLGGAVAEKFALEHSRRVQATVWIGAPTFPMNELVMDYEGEKNVPFVKVYSSELAKGYLNFWNKVWKALMSNNYHESFVNTNIGNYLVRYLFEERYARLNADSSPVISILNGLDETKSSLDEGLAKLSVPAAIVCGSGDDTRPSCEKQHLAIPKAEFLVIQESGHFCYMDQPEIFNRFLSDFLVRYS